MLLQLGAGTCLKQPVPRGWGTMLEWEPVPRGLGWEPVFSVSLGNLGDRMRHFELGRSGFGSSRGCVGSFRVNI